MLRIVSCHVISEPLFMPLQSIQSGPDKETEPSTDGKMIRRPLWSSLAAMPRSQCEELLRLESCASCSTVQLQTRYLLSQTLLTPARSHVQLALHTALQRMHTIR